MADGYQVLIAFQNTPLTDPATITSVASPGTPGTPFGTPPTLGGVNVWTDVSQYVEFIEIRRGRQHELDRFEAGEAKIGLNNTSGVFNPWNTSSPFYGYLDLMKIVQIRCIFLGVSYTRYTGYTMGFPTEWPDGMEAHATLQCYDAFRILALADIVNTTAYRDGVLALSPAGYYRFNEVDGAASILDSSGNNRNGSYVGSPAFGYGGALSLENNYAVDFPKNGSGAYANIPSSAGVSGKTWTVAGWIYLHSVPTLGTGSSYAQYHYCQTEYVGGVGRSTLAICTANNGMNSGGNPNAASLMVITQNADPLVDGYVLITSGTVPTRQWVHVAVKGDGTNLNLYVNGVRSTSNTALSSSLTMPSLIAPTSIDFCQSLDTGPSSTGYISYGPDCAMDEWVTFPGVALSDAQIAALYNNAFSQWAGQDSGTRVGKILDAVGWPAGARNVDTSGSIVQAVTSSLSSTKALSYMQLVEQSEDGALYMFANGQVGFVSRQGIVKNSQSVVATFGDGVGEIPFEANPDIVLDDLDLWNDVITNRTGGTPQEVQNTSSQTSYGRRTKNNSDLLLTSDLECYYRSLYDLDHYQTPMARIRRVSIGLQARNAGNPADVTTILANCALLSRVVVNRHYIPGSTVQFNQQALIEGVTETYDVQTGEWHIDFALSPTDARTYWILGSSTYSVLGSTTRLGY